MRLGVWLPGMSQRGRGSSHHSCISVISALGLTVAPGPCVAPMAMPVGCCPQPPCASTQSPADSLGIHLQPPHGSATSPALVPAAGRLAAGRAPSRML